MIYIVTYIVTFIEIEEAEMGIKTKLEAAAVEKAIGYLFDDPERNIPKIMDLVDRAVPAELYPSQRRSIRRAIEERNNWYELILRFADLDRYVAKRMGTTFAVSANLACWPVQEKNRDDHGCNIPWAILLDPTSACNLHCRGCWANDFAGTMNLSYDEIDSIIRQGKALGTHVYIYTGGEPLVRKRDLIRLCEEHPDCLFLSFTNATLIDDAFVEDMARVANFVPAISVEGFREATDSRRGEGTFAKVTEAMRLMRKRGLPFGVSCCYTSANVDDVASEQFFDWLIEQGALFAWLFTYMPIGKSAPTDLMASADQREYVYHFVRKMRDEKPLFTMDFWNDGEFVGGCIAGGRRYLHIAASGDVEPCVFAHYSNANIRESTLLEALKSPLFMEYHDCQPFNENLLRPCPILDNPGELAQMVERSGAASTNPVDGEEAADLCAKCADVARAWEPVANRLWEDPADPRFELRHRIDGGMAQSDLHKFAELGRLGEE